jgi:ribonuclease I
LIADIIENGEVKVAYKGKYRKLFKGFTIAAARWLLHRLSQLSDSQIRDAFRAANYSSSDVEIFAQSVRRKIDELESVVDGNLAAR